jgi:hypothetical protein
MIKDRELYYFHIQHDRCEMGKDCPASYVNANDEWRAIEETLESLPTPHKMYNDSFLPKDENSQHEEIVSLAHLMCAFTLQPYLRDDERKLLQAQLRMCAMVRQDEQIIFLKQLMGDFATCASFSNNDRILLKLASRGTKFVACESQERFRQYERCRAALKALLGSAYHTQEERRLLEAVFRRNEFISGQIGLSLKPGEVGVLFLGHLHNAENDMVKRLTSLQIPFEEKNECRASEALRNLFGTGGVS